MESQLISTGMKALALNDQDIAQALQIYGEPAPRHREKGFKTFLSIIVSQQISTKVAQVIMARVFNLLPEKSAQSLLLLNDKDLRNAGLSYRKIEYAKGLAEAIHTGSFDIERLDSMSNEEAIDAITALRGFGRWSAEIYLMFSLKRQDVFPADDLALQVALGRLKKLPAKPTPKKARELVAHWVPWRSAGSLFLWHYYHGAPT